MAFVPGYDQDVFISYAHLDDETEWVRTFVEKLTIQLRQRLGTKDLRVWFDAQLAGNEPLTSQIMDAIRRSATLLVVMSRGYLKSSWCERERTAFLDFARDCVAEGRVFVVHARDVDRNQAPKAFSDLKSFRFCNKDGEPLELSEKDGVQRVYELSHQLSRKLDRMGAAPLSAGRAQAATELGVAFVARSTDDLESREEELAAYLDQAGIEVLPRTWYPQTSVADFTAAMEADVRKCRVFAQLLSASRGRRSDAFGDYRFPRLQYDIARRTGVPVLQWREPNLDATSIEDNPHRELLDGARVSPFEEFKRAVVDEVRRLPAITRAKTNVMTFVDADAPDLRIAATVGDFLADQGVACFWPAPGGSPEEVRQDLERNLHECDGLVLVYGHAAPLWVRDKLLQIRKITSQRERPLAALALFVGPPSEKQDPGFRLPNLITVDCRDGVRTDALRAFVEQLRAV